MHSFVLCPCSVEVGTCVFSEGLSHAAAITKYHKLGRLQTTEMGFLQFWRLEAQNQGQLDHVGTFFHVTKFSLCPHMVAGSGEDELGKASVIREY